MKFLLTALITVISFSSFGAPAVTGLVCDQQIDGRASKNIVTISTVKPGYSKLSFFDSDSGDSFGTLTVSTSEILPILNDSLAKMDKKTLVDKSTGLRLDFRVSGTEYTGKAYLAALVTGANARLKLDSCLVQTAGAASY